MMKKPLFWIFAVVIVTVFLFQNCSNVTLVKPSEVQVATLQSTGHGQICIDSSQVLESLVVTNLNTVMMNNKLYPDSDADGISDDDEVKLGTNPLKRRSNGKVLDRICQKVDYRVRCENMNLNCSGVAKGWGLNDCDIESLQLDMLYDHPVQGLDSDKDGLVDLLELRSGIFPNISDATEDPDHDLRSNSIEIEAGTDPGSAELKLESQLTVQLKKVKMTTATCAGQLWNIEILNLPIIPLSAVSTAEDSEFDHSDSENLLAIVLKTRPKVGVAQNAKVYTLVKKLSFDLQKTTQAISFTFTTPDLTLRGEVEP